MTMMALVAAVFGAAAAEKNLFENDGCFAPERAVSLTAEQTLEKCSVGLVPGVYEKGTALLAVTNRSPHCLMLWTKTFPVCGDLMVFEVMVRAVGRPTDCSVIGITSRYKQIAHKHYRLTNDWRKYVAILAVPADAKGPDRLWRGRVDIPSGATVEIGRIALYPATSDESIAGMAKTAEEEDAEARKKALGPNLADFDGPVPTFDAFLSSQVGNANPITALKTRRSDEYEADSALGASITGPTFCQCPVTGKTYPIWSSYWAIADDDLRQTAPCATFSTHMLSHGTTNAELTVKLAAPAPLTKLRITTRDKTLAGFPYDWHVDVSEDGKSFRTVWTVTNFNAKGESPECALDGKSVSTIRIVADRVRPESKTAAYFQLDRVEALDAAGVNHALISKGATADTNYRMVIPVVDRETYLEDAIVNCGIKTVLLYGCGVFSKNWPYLTPGGGFTVGSPRFENYMANLRYLKAHGVKAYIRQSWGNRLFSLRTQEDLDKFKAEYVAAITPYVKAMKGLAAGYPLGGEENQYFVIGRGRKEGFDVAFFKRAYREAVIAASDAIHAIDPEAKTSVITALFDFGWTEEHLKNGMGKSLDEVSVDLYREMAPFGSYPEKCESFFVDGRRGFEEERLFTRAEDEFKAFRKLLDKYNPRLRFGVHETSQRFGPYPKGINSTERGQAKSALRTYILHQYYNIVPTCWWDFCGNRFIENKAGDFYEWGVIAAGVKRQAWYAMQRFAAVFDCSWKPLGEMPLKFSPVDERYYSYLFGRGKERLATCWTAVSMRDQNTGKLADVFVPGEFGDEVPEVECIDLLNGGVQKLNVEKAPGGFKVRNLVMRDYPLVFRYATR